MKKNKGITLIALIITIIVMIVLIAVTLSTTLKSEMLSKAKQAKDEDEVAQIKEEVIEENHLQQIKKYSERSNNRN